MRVYVKTLTGKTVTLQVAHIGVTVREMKEMIHDKEGIPPDQQQLIFGGKQLHDSMTFEEALMSRECTLVLVIRIRGWSLSRGNSSCTFGAEMTGAARKRLMKELGERWGGRSVGDLIREDKRWSVTARNGNVGQWDVKMPGPVGSPYEGELLRPAHLPSLHMPPVDGGPPVNLLLMQFGTDDNLAAPGWS